jgi:adenine-specific DNA methylase
MSYKNIIPFEKIYQASLKEASRKKPIFFIHKYFARRITSNFRMSLLDFMYDDDNIYEHFYNPSGNKGKGITILDPFMGGGTTILEALRFGCNVIGNDLQPLSYFVTKALIEPLDEKAVNAQLKKMEKSIGNRIKTLYKTNCPCCDKEADMMYAFHVKKSKSSCNDKPHRFFSTFIIAFKKDEFTVVCPDCGKLQKTKFENGGFTCGCGWHIDSPKDSYVNRGVFECPSCNEKNVLSDYVVDGAYPFETDIVAIEYYCPHCKSHDYKTPDKEDIDSYNKAGEEYERIKQSLPIPQQQIPAGYNTNQIINHGYQYFKDLFNKRQLLSLGLLLNEINNIPEINIKFWFQLAFSGMLEMNNMFCRYQQNACKISNIFFNHAYVPISMPVENCVWGTKLGTGTFLKTISKVMRGKDFNKEIYDLSVEEVKEGKFESVKRFNGDIVEAHCVQNYEEMDETHPFLICSDSRNLGAIPNESVDLVLTDPPYGANVMYSELIDFFHSWNYMSSSADLFGFTTPLSPKTEEILVNNVAQKDFDHYQDGITSVFSQCHKKVKEGGYLVFSFHDKSFDSWISILNSIYASGFILVKTYPVQAETRTGAHTSGKNSIGIDMMLISQKRGEDKSYFEITEEVIKEALQQTLIETGDFVDRFNLVNAEFTLPDIENIAIAVFFKNCQRMKIYNGIIDTRLISNCKTLITTLEDTIKNLNITEKRTGWWSKLFAEKWNV